MPCAPGPSALSILAASLGLAVFASSHAPGQGQLDPAFGTSGIALTDVSTIIWERVYSTVLQSNGKILIAGQHHVGNQK